MILTRWGIILLKHKENDIIIIIAVAEQEDSDLLSSHPIDTLMIVMIVSPFHWFNSLQSWELTMGDTGAGVMTSKVSIRSWEPEHHWHHWQSHRIRRKNLICFTFDPLSEEKFNIQFLFLIRQWWGMCLAQY